ncbi:MAG: hypothetical protein WB663_02435 [Beijerinckiaceae bacterium]|jgi:hypothetical protein
MSKEAKGQQPESLSTFKAAAQTDKKVKPKELGVEADSKTAPPRDDLKAEQKAGADILRAGAERDPARAAKAIGSRKDKDRRDV